MDSIGQLCFVDDVLEKVGASFEKQMLAARIPQRWGEEELVSYIAMLVREHAGPRPLRGPRLGMFSADLCKIREGSGEDATDG